MVDLSDLSDYRIAKLVNITQTRLMGRCIELVNEPGETPVVIELLTMS